MGVKSSAQAVLKAIELGILDLDEFASGLNIQAVRTLTPSELKVLAAMVETPEADSRQSNKALADRLFYSVKGIEFHKGNIFKRLGVDRHIQACLIYMAAKKAGLINPQ